jgi:serine/threonine protein kinase
MSIIFNADGDFIETNDTIDSKNYFCKYSCEPIEIEVYKILKKNPCKNIVDIYRIEGKSVYIEKLNTNIKNFQNFEDDMLNVKAHLHSLNICYIDWKLENIGLSENGIFKLFDFDCCGIIDQSGFWKVEPSRSWAYKNAIAFKYEYYSADNFCFYEFFNRYRYR